MLSMTGFGNGEGIVGQITVTVELRSVNHRFLDVSLKLPGSMARAYPEVMLFCEPVVKQKTYRAVFWKK